MLDDGFEHFRTNVGEDRVLVQYVSRTLRHHVAEPTRGDSPIREHCWWSPSCLGVYASVAHVLLVVVVNPSTRRGRPVGKLGECLPADASKSSPKGVVMVSRGGNYKATTTEPQSPCNDEIPVKQIIIQ